MNYREQPPPPGTEHLVKARWTLDCAGSTDEAVHRLATPDGCIELIWRIAGQSWWRRDQPAGFVAGIVTAPAQLRMSGDARFEGVRLWPWTWLALGGVPCADFLDDWLPLANALPVQLDTDVFLLPQRAADAVDQGTGEIARAVLAAGSVGELAAATGRSHRWLQRWFERHVGISPRAYLRLLRFQEALAGLEGSAGALAAHAADHGYADQAHMARDFRDLAHTPARTARSKVRGPFL